MFDASSLLIVLSPFLLLVYSLVILRNYPQIIRYFQDLRISREFYSHKREAPAWLTEAVEELRGERLAMLDPAMLGRKPLLVAVAEEYLKREQLWHKGVQPTAENSARSVRSAEVAEEMPQYETEADKMDDHLRHEFKVRRAMFQATEMAKRINYRPVAHRRLFHEPSPRYRHIFRTLKSYRNGQPTASTVMHSLPNEKFPSHFKEKNRPEFKNRPQKKKDPIYSEF